MCGQGDPSLDSNKNLPQRCCTSIKQEPNLIVSFPVTSNKRKGDHLQDSQNLQDKSIPHPQEHECFSWVWSLNWFLLWVLKDRRGGQERQHHPYGQYNSKYFTATSQRSPRSLSQAQHQRASGQANWKSVHESLPRQFHLKFHLLREKCMKTFSEHLSICW